MRVRWWRDVKADLAWKRAVNKAARAWYEQVDSHHLDGRSGGWDAADEVERDMYRNQARVILGVLREDYNELLADLNNAFGAMNRVRAVHRPVADYPSLCAHCSYDGYKLPWPCPTVQALDGEG